MRLDELICDSITKTLATPCSASCSHVICNCNVLDLHRANCVCIYALCTFATRHFFTRLRQLSFVWAKFVFAPTFEVPPFFFPTIFLLLSTVLCLSTSSSSGRYMTLLPCVHIFNKQIQYLLQDIDVKLAWEIQRGSQEFVV
ncbi:hypothetical protein EDD22DRAFT_974091 [Suillus occidentalis]|nr:hypothetical protein EDD22DRAFT_974091 [Suillus occidentalis]